jgi:plastocyanin
VRRMRFAISLLGLLLLAPAGASAATSPVQVGSDFFLPTTVPIAKGDSVHWDWVDGVNEHTVTSRRGQTDSFRSAIQRGGNEVFDHTFRFPGRFRYFCKIHPFTMKGVVRVGTPETVRPKIRRARYGSGKVRFRLSERSSLKLTLKRGTRRVKRITRALSSGRHAIRVGSLKAGSYTAVLQATDGWGNRSKIVRVHFTIG